MSAGGRDVKGNLERFQGVPAKRSRRKEVPTKEGDQPSEQRKLSQSGCEQITAAVDHGEGEAVPAKDGLLSWLVPAGKEDGKGNLVRRERNNCGSPPPHRAKVGGLLGGRRTVAGSQTPQEPAAREREAAKKGMRNTKKVERTPGRKRKVDNTGLIEMQKLMKNWSGKRKERENAKDEVTEDQLADAGEAVVVDVGVVGDVETCETGPVMNRVEVVRKKFDKPDMALHTDSDFDSWKRRKTSLHLTVEHVDVGHELHVREGQQVGSEKTPLRISEREERGLKLKSIVKNNITNCSMNGGTAVGVQRDIGGQGRGGVLPALFRKTQQRDPRRGDSFLVSDGIPGNAAATVGKPVLLGKADSTKSVH